MNESIFKNISKKLVPRNYLDVGLEANRTKSKIFQEILEKRKIPNEGLPDSWIEEFIKYFSTLDSNNFPKKCGLGEREARIASSLVARRHFNFGHGIGRSGDLLEAQPKAAGSTLLNSLTNELLVDFFQEIGFHKQISCFLVPMATGMTISLCFLALKKSRPKAKYIIWSRIDQKACFKSILCAGFSPIIIQPLVTEKGLKTNLEEFESKILSLESDEILAIYSTTSCFAPRNPDDIVELSIIAQKYNIPHLVNNAYGLQDSNIVNSINRASVKGRLDIFVQSTDKNLLVPVGGAIISSFQKEVLENISKTYAGRASISQTIDVLITLLTLGKQGFLNLRSSRLENLTYLKEELEKVAEKYKLTVLNSMENRISTALSLNFAKENKDVEFFGSMLFKRGVSGTRVISCKGEKQIDGFKFLHWGSQCDSSDTPYLTAAVSLGCEKCEIDIFIVKLQECIDEFLKKMNK